MKSKKLIATIALTGLLAFSFVTLAGCGGKSDEDVIREAITDELDAYKNLDESVVDELIADMDVDQLAMFGIDGVEFMRSYLNGFDYTVESVTVDGDTAQAVITLTCKSFSGYEQALESASESFGSGAAVEDMTVEEMYTMVGQLIMEALDSVEVAQTKPITIEYVKADNVWEPSATASNDVATAMMTN